MIVTRKHEILSLWGVLALCLGTSYAAPGTAPSDYTGSWGGIIVYGDFDISDPAAIPVAINAHSVNLDVSVSANPSRDLDLSLTDATNNANHLATSLDVVCPNCVARPPVRNMAWPGGWPEMGNHLVDLLLVSEGNVMAMNIVGQLDTNPADTGFLYAAWQKTPTEIARDDFIGTWKTSNNHDNYNIRNAGEDWNLEPWDTFNLDAGSAADRIAFGDGPLAGVELLVEGNRAHLTGKTGNLLTFDIVHGGDALAFVVVGQEDYDLSDISLGLGTASMVPVPAAAWLFGSAVLTLTGIARRRRVGRL